MERRRFLGAAVATATLAQAKDVLAGPAEHVDAPDRASPAYLSSVFQEGDRAGGFFELVDDPVAAATGTSPAVPSLGGKVMRRIEADGYVRASHFGAVQGDNANLALQQALDYAGDYRSRLGDTADFRSIEVRLEPDWTYRVNQSLMLPAGVILVGGRFAPAAVISAGDGMENAYLIDTEESRSTDKRYLGVVGVYLDGGPKSLGGYLRLRGTNRARVLQVIGRGGCAGSGFLVDPTNSNGQFENLYFVESVNREVSESEGYVGAVDISGGDHYLSNIYGQVGEVATGKKFGNGRKCGIRIAGHVINAGGRIRGELSEVGVVLDGATYCAFSQIVADLNFGHGIVIAGETHDCAISIASTIGNGRDATDKFFGVYFKGDGAHDNVVGTLGVSRASGHTNSMRFGAHADSKDRGNVVGQFYGGNWTLKTQD